MTATIFTSLAKHLLRDRRPRTSKPTFSDLIILRTWVFLPSSWYDFQIHTSGLGTAFHGLSLPALHDTASSSHMALAVSILSSVTGLVNGWSPIWNPSLWF